MLDVTQARNCKRILGLMHAGALMLDEVDMILHPLKSELNWPLGLKTPLDFTFGLDEAGLRWEIPYHLLDAIFYVTTGRMTVDFYDSTRALDVLNLIKAAVEEGLALKVVQATPHTVLIDKSFYHSKVKTLLAKWMLLWLSSNGVGLEGENGNAQLEDYMLHTVAASPDTLYAVEKALSDTQMKMLNLANTWLQTFIPHVLSKIDRVGYGLLDTEQLTKVDPNHLLETRCVSWLQGISLPQPPSAVTITVGDHVLESLPLGFCLVAWFAFRFTLFAFV
jgi:hypothetical protein